ncbi:hypothetical protein ALC56_10944 [Trachymyrmex septentrionalis]|uniref:Uncharacterized protein n=1 Tax=Trachymyrmex septentrionalis TaxID=34720 RepID=A0A195F2Q4_9HYME|nr:hypothetical protein ALC56_10944 [Trachymyrmex septentrionalis]
MRAIRNWSRHQRSRSKGCSGLTNSGPSILKKENPSDNLENNVLVYLKYYNMTVLLQLAFFSYPFSSFLICFYLIPPRLI